MTAATSSTWKAANSRPASGAGSNGSPATCRSRSRRGSPAATRNCSPCFAAIALRRAGKIEAREVPAIYERIIDGPFGSTITLETDSVEEGDADSPPPSSSSIERRLFWARFADELGDIGAQPESLWDARLGYFGVGLDDVGD